MNRNATPLHSVDFYRQFPKVDLHRHLEGSLRLTTLLEVGRAHGLGLPNTRRLRELVQIGDEEPFTFENFLSKFETLRLFYRSPEIIARLTREAVADAAADGVRYLELRFTPAALGRAESFPLAEVIDWVVAGAREAEAEFGVVTRLIVSFNRHEGPQLAEEVARLAAERLDAGIVGLDLAGNEASFSALPFRAVLAQARAAGLHITLHAGEWGPAANVAEALDLGAERIGHGVRVLDDPQATMKARAAQIPFEVCLTSNYQSGVVPLGRVHPLPRMLALGLNATINTDDPSISQIRLSDEYRLAVDDLGLSLAALQERVLAAAAASFLPPTEKAALITRLQGELAEFQRAWA